MPAPINATVAPVTVHTLAALVVAKTTALPDAPPVAVRVSAGAPTSAVAGGAKAVITWAFSATTTLAEAAAIWPPTLEVAAPIGKLSV